MTRRFWPIALAAASIAVFGCYLVYTQFMVRRFRERAAIDSKIFAQVQRGLLAEPQSRVPQDALFAIQALIDSVGIPMIQLDARGEPLHWMNLPDEIDEQSPTASDAIRAYALALERRDPRSVARLADGGTLHFGDPPLFTWLRWTPYLLVGGGLILALVAATMLRAESRVEREKLWSAMARELAHQMGTPLSALSGWLQVLELEPADRVGMATDTHIANVMRADVERLERVSRRFELIGKPQSFDWVRPEEVIDELVRYFGPRLPRLGAGIRLRTRMTPALPLIKANQVLLTWALENVIKNAVDALGGRGGHILIAVHAREDEVHMHIADDGPGIDPTVRDRIFDPGVSTKTSGWGIGLSLTRRIVEQLHGGRITVRARKRGGTVFDVVLPVVDT